MTSSSGWSTSPHSPRMPTKRRRVSRTSSPEPIFSRTSKSPTAEPGCFRKASSASPETLSEQEKKVVWATHFAPAADIFNHGVEGTAWRSKPSWYIVGKNDRTVHPELERFAAKRMGATTYELESSHVPMLSQPERVIDVIRTAAKAVQEGTAGKARRFA